MESSKESATHASLLAALRALPLAEDDALTTPVFLAPSGPPVANPFRFSLFGSAFRRDRLQRHAVRRTGCPPSGAVPAQRVFT